MKILKENTVPVPRRGKMILTAAFTVLMAASVAAGMATAPEETEIPVLLANGEVITPPVVYNGRRRKDRTRQIRRRLRRSHGECGLRIR